jgi:acetoin:2,6-dichlorophenolindophenol oxidoreductase subunit alpha
MIDNSLISKSGLNELASKHYDKTLLTEMYLKLNLGRRFEEKVLESFGLGLVPGTTHLGIGEEATAVGSVLALAPQDMMYATHRGHAQAVAKGIDINAMMAEIFGKATGICHGKGGSMHIADLDKGVLGANGIVAASLPLACGAALTCKKKKPDTVTLVFFGDGCSNEGAFHESMNLAAVWKLPLLFVCINNTYGMSTHISKVMNDTDIAKRAIPYGMPAVTVDGNDVLAVYEAVCEAREYVAKNGPMLVVENSYRISGHSKSDANLYRTKEEINEWKEKCPIKRMRAYLLENKLFTPEELDMLEQQAIQTINDAVEYAKASPHPQPGDVYKNVYA